MNPSSINQSSNDSKLENKIFSLKNQVSSLIKNDNTKLLIKLLVIITLFLTSIGLIITGFYPPCLPSSIIGGLVFVLTFVLLVILYKIKKNTDNHNPVVQSSLKQISDTPVIDLEDQKLNDDIKKQKPIPQEDQRMDLLNKKRNLFLFIKNENNIIKLKAQYNHLFS